ncbi:type VII secretion-associated serine protease mycosin [Nonomuraea sp. NPDC050536]|uniref:type VII secretion-associated serine protease mycosin n=1 Tax=Nonomuraea sp. NPDC050536 TaxID=3364366 RepID=UPI0037C804F0
MIGRAVLAGVLALGSTGAMPAQAKAAPECNPPIGHYTMAESWAQRRLDVKRVWPLTRGEGVTVAVIDSGVDQTHPQIRLAGKADLTNTTFRDCVGHGTAVAGILAGQYIKGSAFYGVAPGVRLLSIKQSNEDTGDVALLAKAIRTAADLGARVINVSIQASDQPDLRDAVKYALWKDVVIVAAAGNSEGSDEGPAYPASYDGVLSVGSANPDGKRSDFSNVDSTVSVLGPGQDIISTWPRKAYASGLKGTSFATPYVAGVAALVRSRFPRLDQVRVRQRIIATADGELGKGTGAGMVNPLLAVTAILPSEQVAVAPPALPPLPATAVHKVVPPDTRAMGVAGAVAGGALLLTALLVAAARVIPLGRKRGWRASRAN